MPRYDGTGPAGQGPITGKGMGLCRGGRGQNAAWSQFANRRFLSKKEEKEMLVAEKNILREELKAIDEKLAEIQK